MFGPARRHTSLVTGSCGSPGDVRNVDQLLVGVSGGNLHLDEFDLTQGNLIDLIRTQAKGRGITLN